MHSQTFDAGHTHRMLKPSPRYQEIKPTSTFKHDSDKYQILFGENQKYTRVVHVHVVKVIVYSAYAGQHRHNRVQKIDQ